MTPALRSPPERAASLDEAELLARFGIAKVPIFQYRYGQWRYSNIDDAPAQAVRDAKSAKT